MKTKLVNVRLPEKLFEEGKEICKGEYANFQEFIKDSIRHAVLEIKKQRALFNLRKSFGSTKNKKRKLFTKEIKERIAEEHTPERAKEITRKYSLEHLKI